MNYHGIYARLIDRAKNRDVSEGYVERHHIIPKCMGGADCTSNIVALTPEEHYVAHQLLVKMYPDVTGLVNAAIIMSANPHGKRGNKIYGWLRRQYSCAVSIQMTGKIKTPEHLKAISEALKGKKLSTTHREKISKAHTGKKQALSVVESRASKLRGRPRTQECREKLSATLMGKRHSEESKKKMSDAKKEKPRSPRTDSAKNSISSAMKLIWEKRRQLKIEEDSKLYR